MRRRRVDSNCGMNFFISGVIVGVFEDSIVPKITVLRLTVMLGCSGIPGSELFIISVIFVKTLLIVDLSSQRFKVIRVALGEKVRPYDSFKREERRISKLIFEREVIIDIRYEREEGG